MKKPTIDQMRMELRAKGGKVKEPKNTVKAYKLFRVHEKHPGKLFPLFVDANTPVEMNKWVDAKEGEMSNGKVKSKIGALAYRPGWHAGDLPIATHIGEKSDPSLTAPDQRPANHAWAEVEMPHDVDWQSVANERGTNAQGKLVPVKAHITDQIPKGGHYRYKTNPNMTGNWLIGGSMKVNRVLTDKEVEKINRAAGLSDLPRAQPFNKKTYGFASGGVVAPDEWKAEEHVNHNISRMATGGSFINSLVETLPFTAPVVNALGFKKEVYDPAELPMDLSKYGQTDIGLMQNPLRSLPRSTHPVDLPTSIKAYRADPTGKFGGKEGLETLPIQRTSSGGDFIHKRDPNPETSNSYTDSKKAIQELYRHARLLGAAQKYGYQTFTPEEAAAFVLKEGRTDFGHVGVWMGSKREKEFDDMLKNTYNLHPEDQNFLSAINAKKLVAKRLGISLPEAWNGTGKNIAGQTGKDYSRDWEAQRQAALHPKNKELMDLINRAMNEGKEHGLPLRANREKDEIMQRREVPYAKGGEVGGWHDLTGTKVSHMATGGSQEFPLSVPADNDELVPHPKYSWLDKASKGVQAAHDFISAPFGYSNPPGEMVSSLLGVPAVAKTMENMAYGTPLTSGSGMTSNLRPETAEAALAAAPLVGPAVKTVKKVGKAIAPTVAEMAAELAEKGGAPLRQFAVPNEGKLSKEEYSRMMREKYAADNAARAAKKEAAPTVQEVKAPADNLGFYSGVEKAALNLQRKAGTGDDFISDLMKNPGVNQARIEEMGLDALKGRANVTADEVRQLAAKNKPQLSESVRIEHNESKIEELESSYEDLNRELHDLQGSGNSRAISRVEAEIQKNLDEQKRFKSNAEAKFGPKYKDEYNMPNGEDYREIRIKLPSNRPSLKNMSREEYDAAVKKADSEGIKNFTNSMHHDDEENVLLHLRVKNHRDADGKNGLLIDELQSDWHQKGRKEGYLDKEYHQLKGGLTPEDRARLAEIVNSPNWRFDEKMVADYNLLNKKANIAERSNKRVPDAPFKENWYQIGLKRAIKEAADSGMQRVYLTTGKTQNERFALSRQVSEIHYTDRGTLYAYDKDGQLVLNEKIPKDKLPEYIGKEASQKLISQPAEGGNRVLAGVDMDVGGEGMKHWYDNQYINYLKKYANEHGAEVGMTKLPVTRIEEHWPEFRDWFAKNHSDRGSSALAHSYFNQGKNNKYVRDFAEQLEQKYEPVYYIELNPALRNSAKKGQQYKAGGIVRMAIGGITQGTNMQAPTLAQMRMQLNQRKNPDYIDTIGIDQAVDMDPKRYISPNPTQNNFMPVGGVADSNGLPVGGIDQDNMQQGQQFMPQQQQQDQDMQPNPSPQGTPPPEQEGTPQQKMGNMLSMTPQGQALQAMGPAQPPRMAAGGSTKGYVVHQPKKPHPEVGTRFTATPQGNLAKRKKFDIFAHEGKGAIVPIPYDATTRDNLVTSVSGHNLTEPLLTEAGFDYSLDKNNLKNKIGGASNLGIAARVQNRLEQAHKEHGTDVFMLPNTMSDDAENFSHHPAHIVLDLLKQRQLNKKTIQQLNDDLRSQFVPVKNKATGKVVKTYPFKNFVGYDHPVMMEQIIKGGYNLESTPGDLRKAMMDRLGKVNIQKLLDYNLGDLKASILDPDIGTDPKGYMGHTFVKGQPGAALRPGKHTDYDTDYTGTNEGGLGNNRPIEILMPDRYEEIHKELTARPVKKAKSATEMRGQVIGALEKRNAKIAQPINARVINNAGLYEQGLKNGEFDPKNLDSVLAYYKRKGGYKKGGKVSEKTQKDIMKFNVLSKKAK